MQIIKSAQNYKKKLIYARFFCTIQKKAVILQRKMLVNSIINSLNTKKV